MRINFFHAAAALLVASAGGGTAAAQVTDAHGSVTLKQADGDALPVNGAIVDFYRTDIRAEYHVKTDGKGSFHLAGLPFVGTYTLVFSAAGARPAVLGGCRFVGRSDLNVVLEPGDGYRPPLKEARAERARPCITAAASPRDDDVPAAALDTSLQAATVDLASLFAEARIDEMIFECRKLLAVRSDDIEANLYLGLGLFGRREADGAVFLARFLDLAPESHPRKTAAQAMLDDYRSRAPAASSAAPPPEPRRRRR